MFNELQVKLIRALKNISNGFSHLISQNLFEHLSEEGYIFGAEFRNEALASNGTQFIQITATTKPVTLSFGAGVEALSYVDSYYGGTTLTTPTTLTAFNFKPSSIETATAIVKVSTAASALGTQRGNTQVGSGNNPASGVGGSVTSRPSTLEPGETLTLRLTNKGGATKCTSVGVYWTELEI